MKSYFKIENKAFTFIGVDFGNGIIKADSKDEELEKFKTYDLDYVFEELNRRKILDAFIPSSIVCVDDDNYKIRIGTSEEFGLE